MPVLDVEKGPKSIGKVRRRLETQLLTLYSHQDQRINDRQTTVEW